MLKFSLYASGVGTCITVDDFSNTFKNFIFGRNIELWFNVNDAFLAINFRNRHTPPPR